MPCRCRYGLPLGACRSELRDRLLEISVGHFVGVELGAIAGQIEDLDLVLVLGEPSLYRLAMVHPQIVQDQVDLAACAVRVKAVAA